MRPLGVAKAGFVDPEAHTKRFLAAVEEQPQEVCGTGAAGREQGLGGEHRWEPPRPVACKSESGSEHRPVEYFSLLVWASVIGRGPIA